MKKLFTFLMATSLAFTLQAQDITNTLGTGGKLEVKTSAGTPVEVLTVTDGSQVIISDVASPTPKTSVILDLNSTDKTLQFPMLSFNTYVGVTAHGAGRMFWDSDNNRFGMFSGTDILDFHNIIDSRDGPASLNFVQGNDIGTSIYIGLHAATAFNGGAGPNNGDQENVAFGHRALLNLGTADGTGRIAEENTAIGGYAGYEITTGRGNTALGFEAGPANGSGTLNYSTAIGYGARTDADDQLVLGRAANIGTNPATQVVIPGTLTVAGPITSKAITLQFLNVDNGDTYNITLDDQTVIIDPVGIAGGNSDVFLPSATALSGKTFTIKKGNTTNTRTVTVNTINSEKIDSATSFVITGGYAYITVQSNGTNWYIIAEGAGN